MRESLPVELRDFIHNYIHSIAQLELLLFVSSDRSKPASAADAARALCMSEDATHGFFETMRAAGLLDYSAEAGYRFAPRKPEWQIAVDLLRRYYSERRFTIIDAIYADRAGPLQSFADAFRLKRET